jgi:hypothetical protein
MTRTGERRICSLTRNDLTSIASLLLTRTNPQNSENRSEIQNSENHTQKPREILSRNSPENYIALDRIRSKPELKPPPKITTGVFGP